jgi:hypothetical protein
MSANDLYRKAEIAYMMENNPTKAFDLYQKCIKRVMRHENVLGSIFPGGRTPPGIPKDAPSQWLSATLLDYSAIPR